MAQRRTCMPVTEAVLGSDESTPTDKVGGHGVSEAMKARGINSGFSLHPVEATTQPLRLANLERVASGENNQSWPHSASPGNSAVCAQIISTVVVPRVMRLVRLVFVEPTTPPDTPRSIRSTRPSRSPIRSAASSPRRAPVSAATRTSSKVCSATNRSRRRFTFPGSAWHRCRADTASRPAARSR